MSQKRQQEGDGKVVTEGCSCSDDKRRKTPSFRKSFTTLTSLYLFLSYFIYFLFTHSFIFNDSAILEVMKLQTIQKFFEPVFEPFIRKVVSCTISLSPLLSTLYY